MIGHPDGDLFVFVLENAETGQIRGTCQVFSKVGMVEPFYSYRISTLTQTSPELGKTFRAEMLTLCTDFEGCAEVGGLFLHPNERAGGLGVLLARSRYLFIKLHRARFPDEVLAELRGVIDEAGGSPFWDAIAGRFFGMNFQEADAFNGAHGTRFIADLMPKTPIYTAMISESARGDHGRAPPVGPGGDADARAGGLHRRRLCRHFRRRPDHVGADRPAPHRSRIARAGAGRDRGIGRGPEDDARRRASAAASPAAMAMSHHRRGQGDARRRRRAAARRQAGRPFLAIGR